MSGPAIVTLANSPVPYKILKSNPCTLQGQNGVGWTATIDFLVAANDWFTFAAFAAGTPTTVTVSGTPVTRIIPLSHPAASKLLCTGIQSSATGQYVGSNAEWLRNHDLAKVSLTFTSVPYAVDGSTPFLTVETHVGSNTYTLAGSKLAFGDGTPIQADAGIDVPSIVYAITIYQAPGLADDVMATAMASPVNSASVTLGAKTWSAGFLKCLGMDCRSTMTANFQQSYERTIMVEGRSINWNYFLKPDGTWDVVTKPGGGNVYATSDLNALFF